MSKRPYRKRDEALEQRVVEAYKAGNLSKNEIIKEYRIDPRWLYDTLHKHNVQLKNAPKQKNIEVFCDVCGQPLAPPVGSNRGAWRYIYACKDWQCRNILKVRPELRDKDKIRHQATSTKKGRGSFFPQKNKVIYEQNKDVVIAKWADCVVDPDLMKQLTKHTPTDERWWQAAGKDERGVDANEAAVQSPWNALSRQHVGITIIDKLGGEVSVSLRRRRHETTAQAFARVFLGNDIENATGLDYVLIWRCSCPLKTQAMFETLDELPTEKGFHYSCPCCGAVCMEVS